MMANQSFAREAAPRGALATGEVYPSKKGLTSTMRSCIRLALDLRGDAVNQTPCQRNQQVKQLPKARLDGQHGVLWPSCVAKVGQLWRVPLCASPRRLAARVPWSTISSEFRVATASCTNTVTNLPSPSSTNPVA
ncbi:MAG: hypothetical protein ACKPKO_01765, partial [Candidatus Fonsibacter sp.]